MIEFADALAAFLNPEHMGDELQPNNDKIQSFMSILGKLRQIPDIEGRIMIRSRDMGGADSKKKDRES